MNNIIILDNRYLFQIKNEILRNINSQYLITACTPRSNGKIERFWQGIKKVVEGKTRWYEIIEAIDTYINYYKYDNHHRELQKIRSTNPTPA